MKYSQFDEEQHILAAFGGAHANEARTRKFLDIGAWNATCFSNTRALYERGWAGVMIEPSPEPFLSLLKEYGNEPRVQLLCAAVGWEGKLVEMSATADGVSTSVDSVRETWKEIGGYYGKFWSPVITWADIFNQFGGFDFISIDAEGLSAELFLKLLETECRPKCLCVEHDSRTTELLARVNGEYHATYVNGTNIVLVRK